MKSDTKEVIKVLASANLTNVGIFGDVVASVLFKKERLGLLIEDGLPYLFVESDRDSSFATGLALVAEIISVLESLEREHSIYVIKDIGSTITRFFYEGNHYLSSCGIKSYSIGSGSKIEKDNNDIWTLSISGKNVLIGMPLDKYFGGKVVSFFNAYIYPTASLNDYIKRGYQTLEQKAIKVSRISIFVAIIISLLSPLESLLLDNKWGKTTLIKHQFDKLIMAGDRTFDKPDSLIVNNFEPLKSE